MRNIELFVIALTRLDSRDDVTRGDSRVVSGQCTLDPEVTPRGAHKAQSHVQWQCQWRVELERDREDGTH